MLVAEHMQPLRRCAIEVTVSTQSAELSSNSRFLSGKIRLESKQFLFHLCFVQLSALPMNLQQHEEINRPASPVAEIAQMTETHGKVDEVVSRSYITGWRLHTISTG